MPQFVVYIVLAAAAIVLAIYLYSAARLAKGVIRDIVAMEEGEGPKVEKPLLIAAR